MGICLVTVLSFLLVAATHGILGGVGELSTMGLNLLACIWGEAGTAMLCMGWILFAGAGVGRRTRKTCYPIPDEVERRIRGSQSLEGMSNIAGPTGSRNLGSYCVRCLVW